MSRETIELVIVDGDQETPLPVFLRNISRGAFTSPRQEGFWRIHDQDFHWARLAYISSEDARLAMSSSHTGLQLFEEGKLAVAIEVADMVDGLLSVSGPHNEERKYLWSLVEHFGLQEPLF